MSHYTLLQAKAVYAATQASCEAASDMLRQLRDQAFPVGAVVRSKGEHTQWGIVETYGACPPDKIGVLFENGNTWDKDFAKWEVVSDRKSWPADVKRRVRIYKRKRKAA
jgi:hypothetical protein